MRPFALYADGGIIGPNPSSVGGTWAWCWVDSDGKRIKGGSGIIGPAQCFSRPRPVTNNLTELAAALMALNSVPDGWEGILYTDSRVTQYRLQGSQSFKNIPSSMRDAVAHHRRRLHFGVVLVAGHPSKEDLDKGYRGKYPVSVHNQWCDQECSRLAIQVTFMEVTPSTERIVWGPKVKRGFGLDE